MKKNVIVSSKVRICGHYSMQHHCHRFGTKDTYSGKPVDEMLLSRIYQVNSVTIKSAALVCWFVLTAPTATGRFEAKYY
jgi:hypothetical protein